MSEGEPRIARVPYSKYVECINFAEQNVIIAIPQPVGHRFGNFNRMRCLGCKYLEGMRWRVPLAQFGHVHNWLFHENRENFGSFEWVNVSAVQQKAIEEREAAEAAARAAAENAPPTTRYLYWEEKGNSPTPSELDKFELELAAREEADRNRKIHRTELSPAPVPPRSPSVQILRETSSIVRPEPETQRH